MQPFEIGVREITIGYLIVNSKELQEESLYFYKELSDNIMTQVQEKGKIMGIAVNLPSLFKDGRVKSPEKEKCASPWNYAYIRLDGGVKPCCYHPPLGNLFKDDFLTIWNNEGFQELRRRVHNKDLSLSCKRCRQPGNMDPNDIEIHLPNISPEEARELTMKLGRTNA